MHARKAFRVRVVTGPEVCVCVCLVLGQSESMRGTPTDVTITAMIDCVVLQLQLEDLKNALKSDRSLFNSQPHLKAQFHSAMPASTRPLFPFALRGLDTWNPPFEKQQTPRG